MQLSRKQLYSKRKFIKAALVPAVSTRLVSAYFVSACFVPTYFAALIPTAANAQSNNDIQAAVNQFTQGVIVTQGKVKLEIAALIDNGNTVPIEVSVESPMTLNNFVKRIAIFNEKNPTSLMAQFSLSPANGVARVATRVRMATSQTVIAIAQFSDGSFWSAKADVIVTLSACLED